MPDPEQPPLLHFVLLFILILLGAAIAAMKTAYACCNRYRVRAKDEESTNSALAGKLVDDIDSTLLALRLSGSIVLVAAAAIAFVAFSRLLGDNLYGILCAVGVMVLFYTLVGHCLSVRLVFKNCDKAAEILAVPAYIIVIILMPFTFVVKNLTDGLRKPLGVKAEEDPTEEDFAEMIESVEEEGIIDKETSEFIQAAMEFSEITVRDVMTPVEKVFYAEIDDEELTSRLLDCRYSRVPLTLGGMNNVLGIVHIRNYLKALMDKGSLTAKELLVAATPTLHVAENLTLDEVMDAFKKRRTHFAVVDGADKNTIGIVTMEDVLDELVLDNETEGGRQ